MRKIIRLLGLLIIVAVVVMQFFQPEKNKNKGTESDHIFELENVPTEIKTTLKVACLDCHSNSTNYLWYHHIAPVSWMINDHIVVGKNDLNFSEWGKMDVFEKITILEEACQETERKSMPLKSYRIIHPKAKLSEEQIATLCDWTTKLSEELLAKAAQE